MPYPTQLVRTRKVQLSDGSVAGLDLPADGDITDLVKSVTLPVPEIFTVDVPVNGGKGTVPVPYGVLPMSGGVSFKGHNAVLSMLWHSKPTFIVTYELFSLDASLGVTKDTEVHTFTVYIARVAVTDAEITPGQDVDIPLDAMGNATKYKLKHSNAANAAWDLDFDTGVYKRNNVDIF